jgi:excisionase family DNA binding protein
LSTVTLSHDSLIVDDVVRDEAAALVRASGDEPLRGVAVMIEGKPVTVPKGLATLIAHVIQRAAEGGVMTIRSMPDELTTTVAADMLGVSRPTLMKLIRNGELKSHAVGSHHRVKSQDVLALRDRRIAQQREALERLRVLEDQ